MEKILPVFLTNIRFEPLHELHQHIWLRNETKNYRENKWYGKFLFNKITIPIWKKTLNSNLRRLIKGHTLYVSFEKK